MSSLVLIADDEPFYHDWLVDFLESKSITVHFATTIEAAADKIASEKYRFIVVDLTIPLTDKHLGQVRSSDPALLEYPGLYLADFARNSGYRDRQVIVYSVHISEIIDRYVKRLGCTYIPKGRPGLLKEEIISVLAYDPTSEGKIG